MKLSTLWTPPVGLFLLAFAVVASSAGQAADTTAQPMSPSTAEIQRTRVFDEPLVPIGGAPSTQENGFLFAALQKYSQRSGPDDFTSLTGFLEKHPQSPWRAALLTGLGLDYYNSAHYSLALEAWREAWALGQKATDAGGKFLADRAVCDLAGLYSRLGRMTELEALLKSVERRGFIGGERPRESTWREKRFR